MATPRRRSSRLRGLTPQKEETTLASSFALDTLTEREEEPGVGRVANLDAIASSPQRNAEPPAPSQEVSSILAIKTPTTAGRVRPDAIEMHPSRFQSTAKKLASTRRLSLAPGSPYLRSPTRQSHVASKAATYEALGLPNGPNNPFTSPSFEFRYARPSADLSSEAQRIMDEVREQAARIKVDLVAHELEQTHKDNEAEELHSDSVRKLAQAKGSVGRFSNVHTDQFKKMGSIANHPSSFRLDVPKASLAASPLKRSNSKAGLGKPEGAAKRTLSSKSLVDASDVPEESPAKRRKHEAAPSTPSKTAQATTPRKATVSSVSTPRAKSGIPIQTVASTVTTPTQASLARAASVKIAKTHSMIPSLAQSPSRPVSTPFTRKITQPQTEGGNRYKNAFANGLMSVKSILCRPQLRYSDDPLKLAAGTHVATPIEGKAASNVAKLLPSVPEDVPGTPSHRLEKHVMFSSSPAAVARLIGTPGTPSPAKKSAQYSNTIGSLTYPTIQFGDASPLSPSSAADSPSKARASMAGPRDFTFRASKTISFGSKPSAATTTIRPVHPNDASEMTYKPPSKLSDLPSVAHGLSNKKRKRDSDVSKDTDDKENNAGHPQESPVKRTKLGSDIPNKGAGMSKTVPPPVSRLPKAKGRSVLSMARLNALSRPKDRK